jgi:DNA topoisomerase-2
LSKHGETICKSKKKSFSKSFDHEFTNVSFKPDYAKFGMKNLSDDMIHLIVRRAFEISSCYGITCYLDNRILNNSNFETLCKSGFWNNSNTNSQQSRIFYHKINETCEIALYFSFDGHDHMSFVNGYATTRGGSHVDYIETKIIQILSKQIKKDLKTNDEFEYSQIWDHLILIANCFFNKPVFDSVMKDKYIAHNSNFQSRIQFDKEFESKLIKSSVYSQLVECFEMHVIRNKKPIDNDAFYIKAKSSDPNQYEKCLIIADESAFLSIGSVALSAIDNNFGFLKLIGKVPNVLNQSIEKSMKNSDVLSLISILGIKHNEKYASVSSMNTLVYQSILMITNNDTKRVYTKAALIGMFQLFWPNILKHNFIKELVLPK